MKKGLFILIGLIVLFMGCSQEESIVTQDNMLEQIEYFYTKSEEIKKKDFRKIVDIIANQFQPNSETATKVSGFLNAYFKKNPHEYDYFQNNSTKFRSDQWVKLFIEAKTGELTTIQEILALNREFWYANEYYWFNYFVNEDLNELKKILNFYEKQWLETKSYSYLYKIKSYLVKHKSIADFVSAQKSDFYELINQNTLEYLGDKSGEQGIEQL